MKIEINDRQNADWNYEVEKIPLMTPEGEQSGFYATRRIDTKVCLGSVSNRYGILQNKVIFAEAEDIFTELGLKAQKLNYIVTNDGAKARAVYDFENIGFKVKEKDDIHLRLTVQNSFDGTLGASLNVGFVRLVCTNGLMAPVGRGSSIARKHTLSIGTHITKEKVQAAIIAFEKSKDVFIRLNEMPVTTREGRNFLGNAVKEKILSDVMARDICNIWENPTYNMDKDRTGWSLYNAATEHLTHNVAPRRFELANRTTGLFVNALVRGNGAEMFLQPPKEYALN